MNGTGEVEAERIISRNIEWQNIECQSIGQP
jgi:hypothetical protein